MRKAPRPLDALFSRTLQAILAATLRQPDRWWYLSDLAKSLDVSPSSLQRDLARLTSTGIFERREEGNRVYLRPNSACPFLPELTDLLAKTAGLLDVVREALTPFGSRIRAAFIYGSVASRRERSESDVDLFVIGEAGLAELSPALRALEGRLSRPVNATVYDPAEFETKRRSHHHFLRSVLDKEKLFVVGTEHDLEAPGERKPTRVPRHKQARTQ
ncbi:MAG: hypothetical protein HYR85_02175 [Planctomycetes bacterium]|nr:hypothetical protein [Planctomycetota bacterium]MBI3848400.1 hypothetical protein [Planctomycetota bacterium]